MTLFDLLKLTKHNIKFVIAVPVICVIVVVAWSFFTQGGYMATSSFVTNGDLALAQGLASKEASSYSNAEVQVSCSSVSASKQVVIKAMGSNPATCVEVANAVASNSVKQYKEANNTVIATISEASYAVSNSPSIIKAALIAFIAGLFVAICFVVLIDVIRMPIKSRDDIEHACDFPVLGNASTLEGNERVLANLQFRCEQRPATVAVIPVGDETASPIVARGLAGALERSDVRVKLVKGSPHAKRFQVSVPEDAAIVVSCEPLVAGMGAAYIAHSADATILCVSEWADSKKQLSSTVSELELAKANIVGVAYLPEEKKPREPKRAKEPEGE
ncbi:MAG: hypothetical protein V8R08_06815 [Coriobacteriales bacterium]